VAARRSRLTIRESVAGRLGELNVVRQNMPRSVDQIVADLEALTADDFDYNNVAMRGPERLDAICSDVLKLVRSAHHQLGHLNAVDP
jgi:hypothetical protein